MKARHTVRDFELEAASNQLIADMEQNLKRARELTALLADCTPGACCRQPLQLVFPFVVDMMIEAA